MKNQNRQRLKQIRKIEINVLRAGKSILGPARETASAFAAVAFIAVLGLNYLLDTFGLNLRLSLMGIVLLASLVAIATHIAVYRAIPCKSYTDTIYKLLAEYEPIDKDAFIQLQNIVREKGLERDALLEWAVMESESLPIPDESSPERNRFLSKQI